MYSSQVEGSQCMVDLWKAKVGHEAHINVQLTGGGVTMHGGFVERQSRTLGTCTCKCTCISRVASSPGLPRPKSQLWILGRRLGRPGDEAISRVEGSSAGTPGGRQPWPPV